MTFEPEKHIFKITTSNLWNKSQKTGLLSPMPIDIADNYIHFSTHTQLAQTLRLHFKGQSDLMLLGVLIKDLKNDLKWEKSRNNELFPHLYSELNINLIKFSKPIKVDNEGNATLPEFLKC